MTETIVLLPTAENPKEPLGDAFINNPVEVRVRIEYISIGEVDTMNEKYQAEVKITSKWYDDQVEKSDYDKTKDWYPKLFIENALNDLKEEITYDVKIEDGRRLITETRASKGSFWERIELQNFPMDVQELAITLASKLKPSKVKIIADPDKMSNIHSECLKTFRDQQKLKLYKMVKVKEQASYDVKSQRSINSQLSSDFREIKVDETAKRSKIVAICYCSRRPAFYLLNCYLFNFLITSLSITIFSIPVQNRITGTFTLILTSVSFKWVSNRSVPAISYLTSLDKYQIISIFYLVMCCVWHSINNVIKFDDKTKGNIDLIGLGVFVFAFLAIQIAFSIQILIALSKLKQIKKKETKFLEQHKNDSDEDE